MDEKTKRNLMERQRQMTEEGRKQWLSAHTSRGKAYESLGQAFRWLLARRKEARILNRDPWVEPFAADRSGVVTAAEALSLLLRIILLDRDQPELHLNIPENDIKHEMRGDIRDLLLRLDRLHARHEYFLKNGNVSGFEGDAEEARVAVDDRSQSFGLRRELDDFEDHYRRRLQDMIEPSYFPGSPYLEGEVLSRVNYTDTVASLLNLLIDVVRWNEFESGDNDVLELIESSLRHCWDYLRRNARPCEPAGVGWGWAGFTRSDNLTGQRREELISVYELDADRCVPQTYYTARVISALARLYWLLIEDNPARPVFKVQIRGIEAEDVERLLKQGLEGLVHTNRIGDGWIDFDPYHTCVGAGSETPRVQPAGYSADAPEPSLLHTAYAVCALAEPAVLTHGRLSLTDTQKEALQKGILVLLGALDKPARTFLRQLPYKHVLSRTTAGKELAIEDECGVYVLLQAVALYNRLCDWENPVPGFDDVYQLSDDDTKPYYQLAKFILEEVRDPMHDRRGFPAFGERGRNEIDKFPAIRATRAAIEAFGFFGLKQMVPGIDEILDRHLAAAREEIILELVKKYGDLEARGIRVAWGLIESDGETIARRRAARAENGRDVDDSTRSATVPDVAAADDEDVVAKAALKDVEHT